MVRTVKSAFLMVLFSSCSLFGAFTIEQQNVKINSSANIAEFMLTFNRTPDFYNLSGSGNPFDSFQYYMVDDVSEDFPGLINSSSIIRGDEIHFANGIVIRDIFGDGDGSPFDGGFGPIRDIVGFELNGNVLKFSAGFDTLACPDGDFSYAIMLTEDGGMSDWLYVSNIPTVPAPSAFLLGCVGIAGIICKKRKNG